MDGPRIDRQVGGQIGQRQQWLDLIGRPDPRIDGRRIM
jgi:hypothetical protein